MNKKMIKELLKAHCTIENGRCVFKQVDINAASLELEQAISAKPFVSGSLPLPTEADASAYANGAFGYEEDAYDRECGFISGYQWTVDWINSKADGNDR